MKKHLKIVYMPPGELRPSPRNARVHSQKQIDLLAQSIERYGWAVPITLDETGRILAGHGRVLAAVKMGLEEVPTVRIEHLSESDKRAFVIADNKLAEKAGWDRNLLALELGDLSALGYDGMEMLGDIPDVEATSDEIEIQDLDTSMVRDTFWISVQGPLAKQAEALAALRKVMEAFPDITVEIGTRTVRDEALSA